MVKMTANLERSQEQRLEALGKANDTRTFRKGLKADLKSGKRTVASVLLDGEPKVQSMRVEAVLMATPGVGKVKAHKLMQEALGIMAPASKTVGGLSDRQRATLLLVVEGA